MCQISKNIVWHFLISITFTVYFCIFGYVTPVQYCFEIFLILTYAQYYFRIFGYPTNVQYFFTFQIPLTFNIAHKNKRTCNNGRRRGCFLRPALQVLSNMHNILEFFQFYFYNPWFGKREERKITQNVFQSSIGLYELDKLCCGLLLSFPKCEKGCTVITLHVGVDFNLYLIFGWKDWLSTPWFGLCRPFSTFVIIKNVINL